ncbi:MAG: sulfurtransferase TusA family protein [Acidimicrobiales bacterium]
MATAETPTQGGAAEGGPEPEADVVLDVKGLSCPMPVVKTAKAIKELQSGQVLKLLATDPGAIADIPAWAETTGNTVLTWQQSDGTITFWVRKEA